MPFCNARANQWREEHALGTGRVTSFGWNLTVLAGGHWCASSHFRQSEIKLSLQDAVDIFFQEEEIEYICEKCGRTKAKLTHRFARLPRWVYSSSPNKMYLAKVKIKIPDTYTGKMKVICILCCLGTLSSAENSGWFPKEGQLWQSCAVRSIIN